MTPSHLQHKHDITLEKYREMFPADAIYERLRYMKIVQRPVEDFGDIPLEVGLEALKRYNSASDDNDTVEVTRASQILTWSKKTRARIERLFI